MALGVVVGFVLLAALPAFSWARWVYRDHIAVGQEMAVPGPDPTVPTGAPITPGPMVAPYAAGISADGRYFVDQHGQPFLVRGDAPWSLLADLTPSQIDAYWADRSSRGVNAAIVSLIGDGANGGTYDGATVDGVRPFLGYAMPDDAGSVSQPNPAYLARAHEAVASARDHGITVFLYPVDGWVIGHAFRPTSVQECVGWGRTVAQTFADLPNIVWVLGGDYTSNAEPSDVDRCFDGVREGLRAAGDTRPLSIQFRSQLSWSTQNSFWRTRVDWNFLYSYVPPYQGARAAWASSPARPVILGESNYEGLNLDLGPPPTTTQSLRRQVAWALTSGAAGDFYGSSDWQFLPGWQDRMDRPGLTQVNKIRDVLAALPWWQLRPAADGQVITGGPPARTDLSRDVLDDDHPTAAVTADGTLAVAYLPATMTVTVASGFTDARWVDPSTGAQHDADPSWRTAGTLTTPGTNADHGGDWLLVLTGRAR